jgi:hypothetical protein
MLLAIASLLSAALAQGTQSGASWPALGGSTQRSGTGLASGPTDSSVERKWTYSIPSDTSASGPSPLVDSAGNIILVTSGGSLRSLSTTSPTSPSPLFSGTQRDASALGACTAIPLAAAPTANVFTFTSTPSVSFYASGQAVYVNSLGGCSAASLSLTTIYYYIPLSATTFSLSTSQSTLTPITITCTGTAPTLITSMPGALLSIPAYPGVILAIGTAVVASLPCSPSPCTNTVLTSTVLGPSTSAWTLATLTPVLSSISGSAFATTANAIAAFTAGGSTPTAFIFSSLGSCVTSPALSLIATYYVMTTGAPTATSFTFATAVTGGTVVSITSCTTYPTIVVHQTSYTVTPTSGASKFSVTGVASGTLTVANSNSDFVQWQPFIFTSVGTGCSNPPSLTQVYYVASATTTSITYTATQFGGALTSYTTCTTFPVIQPYTQSSGCISTASIAAVAGTTPSISYTSTAPPVLNWAAAISGSTYTLDSVAQSLSQPSFAFQPITATPVFDNNGNLWLPVGQFLLKVLLATGVPQGAYQTSCPVLTTAGSFTASISGSTLTITSIVSTFSGYIAAGTGAQPMTITSVTSPYLPIGALLTASTSSSTTITVVGLSSGQYSVIASPAFTSGLGSSSSPVSFTATLPIGLVLTATGAATGTSIVAVSDTGVSNVYIVSPSQTVASTSTFTSITGLPTSPVIDASGNVVYTCGSSIVSLPFSSNAPTTRLTASFTAPLSVMSYSSRSGNFYAGDSVGNVWAWNLGSTSVASWFTSTTQVWAWPPSPWPTGVQAMTNGLNAALAPPVVGSTSAGVEQVYVIMCTTAQLCRINALAAATGSDNWLYGTVQSGIQSGFLLDLCYFSTASIVANDKVALLCVSSPASSVSTLKVITNTAVGGLSHSSFSGFKFSTPPVVDASGSTLYFGGRDGCVTGFSLASYTSTWQLPSGCASSGSLSSFGTVQPALTSSVSAATVAATGSSGTPGYLVAMDSSLTVHAYGRYGSATPTASATASGTNSLSISATARPSASAGASGSGTYCASATQSATPSASSCGSASGSLSPTLSTTTSSTLTASPTLTVSACASGSTTGSSTACVSATQSSTQSVTASMCQSSSLSASSTASPSDSMSNSPAPTLSFSLPSTPSALPTSTATLTGSPTPTGTPSQTPTQTPSFTPWQAAIAAAASAAAASAAAAAAAAAAGKGSSASNSSLTDASVAMIVIGTIFLVAALALYYIYLRHPELLHAVFGGPSDKSKSSGGNGSSGSSGSSGSGSRSNRSQSESAEGSEGAEGSWEGQPGSGGGGSAPGNASYRGDVEQGVNSSSSSSSSRASRLNSRTPAGVDESQFNFSSSGVGNLSPYSTHTYVESGSSSVNESSMLGMTAASAAVGAAAAAPSAAQATPGTASRSALKSSQRSSSAAAASYSFEEAQQPPSTEEAPSRRSASSGSRARSRSKGAVNDEEEEVVEAPPTSRRITTAMRRGSLSVKRNSKLAQTPSAAASYEDFTQ